MEPKFLNVQQVVQAVVGGLDFRLRSAAVVSDDSSLSTSSSRCDATAMPSLEDSMKKLNACMQESARTRSLIKKSLMAVHSNASVRVPIVAKKNVLAVDPLRSIQFTEQRSHEIPYGKTSLVTKMKREHRLMRKASAKKTGVNKRSKELASSFASRDGRTNRRKLTVPHVLHPPRKSSYTAVAYTCRESSVAPAASISDFLRHRMVSSYR